MDAEGLPKIEKPQSQDSRVLAPRLNPVSLPFRIDGDLDRKAIRSKPHKVLPDDGRWKKLKEMVPELCHPCETKPLASAST
jgi:hypothetical protein